jgi:hypothetical protein
VYAVWRPVYRGALHHRGRTFDADSTSENAVRPATWWKSILGCALLFMAEEGSLQIALRDTAGALSKLAALLILIIIGGWLMASGVTK